MTGIGIELGPSALRAVVLEGAARAPSARVKIRASRELPCETGNPDALTQALIQLRRTLPLNQPVVLGVPSTSAILATVTPLVANPRRAGLAVQFELQQHLPFELAEAVWHFRWLSQNGQKQGMRNAVAAAMKRSLLDERLACCRRAGLSVGAVAINPVATLNAWETQSVTAASPPVVLLNLLNDPTAEWIIRTATQLAVTPVATSLPQTPSAQAPQAGDAFLQELAASWDIFHQQFPDLPRKIWLVGASAALPRLSEAIAARLNLEVEALRLTRAAALNATMDQLERWTVAIGLALQGLGLAPVSLNLLDRAQAEGRARRVQRTAVLVSGVLALLAIGFGLKGMMEVRSRRTLLLQSLEKQERLYRTLRPKVQALVRHQQYLEARSHQLERLVTDRILLTRLLAQVSEALPETAWLTKLECTKEKMVEGTLEGRATSFQDVTQFLDQLKSAAAMTTVKPLATNVITEPGSGKELVTFVVQIQREPS
ncbi:MAG: pilus assembly protein PilM [Candidatus Omnitrophica bacterium]|nr:pilus assembly protein PilM [Candidatus Omnitrophota bacterium]